MVYNFLYLNSILLQNCKLKGHIGDLVNCHVLNDYIWNQRKYSAAVCSSKISFMFVLRLKTLKVTCLSFIPLLSVCIYADVY
jgi:hypothetical protein